MHFDATQQRAASFGRFQVEAVVADEAEDDAVAINAVVAEHLFHRNLARTSTLVGDVLNEVWVACHGEVSFVIAQRYEKNRKPDFCLGYGLFCRNYHFFRGFQYILCYSPLIPPTFKFINKYLVQDSYATTYLMNHCASNPPFHTCQLHNTDSLAIAHPSARKCKTLLQGISLHHLPSS